jgi:sarcosine oxidase / L-pipecolate oxidase
MGSTTQSYLIVGAGVFGASTALHLRRLDPSATVTLLDRTSFPNPSAASHDVNKIIRADYDDIFYMKLALEAQKLWRDDPIYSPYYHETGMLFAEDMGMGRKAFEHYKTLGGNVPVEMLTPEEARERFPWFKDANWTDVKENFYNPTSGWGEADHALRRLVQAAVDEGAIFVTGTVSKILIDQSGTCTGVLKDDGEELTADHILLCTGPYTAKLLADSAPNKKELQVDGRMVAAAAVQMTAKVDDDHLAKYRQAPVHFNGMYHTHGL